MNEPRDPIEEELSALRPVEVSLDLRRRVAAGLAAPPPGASFRRWRPALAGALAAAGLAAVVFRWGGGTQVDTRRIVVPPSPASPVAADESRPVLLAYQRALARSPEDLGALLDRQALADPGPEPGLSQIRGLTRSETVLRTLLGDD